MRRFSYTYGELCSRLLSKAAPIKSYIVASTLSSIIGNLSHMGLMGSGALMLLSAAGVISYGSIGIFFLLMLSCALLIALCRYVEGVASHKGAYKLLAVMRVELFERLRRLAPACLVDRSMGDIMNIAISDIETLEYFFAHTIGPMFTVILLPSVTLVIAFCYAPLFAAVLLPVYVLISIVIPLLAISSGRSLGMRYRRELAGVKTQILESVYGIRDIQIFSYGAERLSEIDRQNDRINKAAHGLLMHRQIVSTLPTFFVYAARVLIIWAAVRLTAQGQGQPIGTVVLSAMAGASFSSTFSLTQVVTNLLEAFAAAERLFLLEDEKPKVAEPRDPVSPGKIRSLEFRDVSFSYDSQGGSILSGLSFSCEGSERIGIQGESGAGKSTIFRLLLRFWDPDDGEILINGIPISSIATEELYRRIAVLEQDTFLIDGTLAENIALGRPEASREEIMEAAKRAGLHEFIMSLPGGYDTPMGQMSQRLSGGERQRVGIARVMLKDPDVVIMDEPTSSLDVLHEKELLDTVKKVYADKLVLIISHRASTLSGCDRTIRLEKGRII